MVIVGATFTGKLAVRVMSLLQALILVLLCTMVRRQTVGMKCQQCGEEIFARDVDALNYKATIHGCGN
jgi:hypothetical protein